MKSIDKTGLAAVALLLAGAGMANAQMKDYKIDSTTGQAEWAPTPAFWVQAEPW